MRQIKLGVDLGYPTLLKGLVEVTGDLIMDLSPLIYLNESDPTTMSINRDGTGGVPSIDDPVGRIMDISGNDLHAVAPSDAERPVLKADGTTFNGLGQMFKIDLTSVAKSSVSIICLIKTTDFYGILFSGGVGTGRYMPIWSTAGIPAFANSGSPTFVLNNIDLGIATRSEIQAVVLPGGWIIFEIIGASMADAAWDDFTIAGYGGSYFYQGVLKNLLVLPSATYSTHRDSLIYPFYQSLLA